MSTREDNDILIAALFSVAVVFVLAFSIISAGYGGYNKGRYEVWRQAIEKGYAQEVETSEGKAFQWK